MLISDVRNLNQTCSENTVFTCCCLSLKRILYHTLKVILCLLIDTHNTLKMWYYFPLHSVLFVNILWCVHDRECSKRNTHFWSTVFMMLSPRHMTIGIFVSWILLFLNIVSEKNRNKLYVQVLCNWTQIRYGT